MTTAKIELMRDAKGSWTYGDVPVYDSDLMERIYLRGVEAGASLQGDVIQVFEIEEPVVIGCACGGNCGCQTA